MNPRTRLLKLLIEQRPDLKIQESPPGYLDSFVAWYAKASIMGMRVGRVYRKHHYHPDRDPQLELWLEVKLGKPSVPVGFEVYSMFYVRYAVIDFNAKDFNQLKFVVFNLVAQHYPDLYLIEDTAKEVLLNLNEIRTTIDYIPEFVGENI